MVYGKNSTAVAVNEDITATFSEAMDAATITAATFDIGHQYRDPAGPIGCGIPG